MPSSLQVYHGTLRQLKRSMYSNKCNATLAQINPLMNACHKGQLSSQAFILLANIVFGEVFKNYYRSKFWSLRLVCSSCSMVHVLEILSNLLILY